jgi:hypothetical protein
MGEMTTNFCESGFSLRTLWPFFAVSAVKGF